MNTHTFLNAMAAFMQRSKLSFEEFLTKHPTIVIPEVEGNITLTLHPVMNHYDEISGLIYHLLKDGKIVEIVNGVMVSRDTRPLPISEETLMSALGILDMEK